MAYNEDLGARINSVAADWPNWSRKKMFGGICHLLNGNMFSGVYKDYLILRLGPKAAEAALGKSHVRPFDITGRSMSGWVMIEEPGFKGDKLTRWLNEARAFAQGLPPK
ncbi:MAG: RNA methyltransferase [Desulfobacca sp.]|nr:RNA methyltransferase [Desulfobacca sp.]